MRLVLAQSVVAFAPDPLQHTLLKHAVLKSLKSGTKGVLSILNSLAFMKVFLPSQINVLGRHFSKPTCSKCLT